jgi:RNA 3'-terminal phosphate cyclase
VATSVARMCGAALRGEAIRSTEISFIPRRHTGSTAGSTAVESVGESVGDRSIGRGGGAPHTTNIETGTAASMTLIVQALLPLVVLSRHQRERHVINITGGTVSSLKNLSYLVIFIYNYIIIIIIIIYLLL